MSDLLKRRYVRGSEIELQNALVEAHDEVERLKREITRQLDRTFAQCTRIENLEAALREIAACPQKRHRADGDVDVYYNGATMLKIAKEALGDE